MVKRVIIFLLLIILPGINSFGQIDTDGGKNGTKSSNVAAQAGSSSVEEDLISVGDTLDIRVFNRPQMSREAVRVDPDGKVKMPFLDHPVQAACQTERSLAAEITRQYLEFLRNPQVEVIIKEYRTLPFAAVLGSVRAPSRLQLQKGKQIRLLEALAYVGGPSDQAGNSIQVIHTGKKESCRSGSAPQNLDELNDSELKPNVYNLKYLLAGDNTANPLISSGDIVILPEAEQVIVIGRVVKPSNLTFTAPMTVTQAIALSGGMMPDTNREKIRIRRQLPNSAGEKEIIVNLREVEQQKTPDPLLEPNDVIEVPVNGNQVFVVGNVTRPSTLPLSESITLTKAIAMSGGLLPDSNREKIRILRQQTASVARKEILVNLKEIESQKTPDLLLEPDDIVDVPVNGGKRFLRSIFGGVVPAIGQLPIRVIP